MTAVTLDKVYYLDELKYKPDLTKFEKEFKPKIDTYKTKIKENIPKEATLPKVLKDGTELPEDFDTAAFKGASKIGELSGIMTPKELKIVKLPGVEIVDKIAKGELTSVETITAFIKQAAIAIQVTNCAMEFFPEEALARAKELDEYYEKTGKTVGPLHGLPFSLKEHYAYKGKNTNAGFVSMIDNFTEEDALTTEIFRKAGAVFYIRTTQPQSLMCLDSYNNLVGRCSNPHNTALSPGGSTSGEAALIALNGSPLGTGSDIGGSIRAPAAFCNIWGFKPTNKRVSLKGAIASYTDMSNEFVLCSVGPLANNPEDIKLYMSTFLDAEPWKADNYMLRMPWRKDVKLDLENLKIGIVYDDSVVKPAPPMLRALKLAAESLKKAGATVLEWEALDVPEAMDIVNTCYNIDGNHNHVSRYEESGEPLNPLSENHLRFGHGFEQLSILDGLRYVHRRDDLRQKYNDRMNELGVDYILTPSYFAPAAIPHKIKYWGYTALYNILDLPGVTFPTGLVTDAKIDTKDVEYKPRNDLEAYEYPLYDEKIYDSQPIALTLHGRRYYDEETVEASKIIQKIISEAASSA
ncbi:uncharacterized protein SCDLUD_001579 [Saccharomycodes ludwigii]|uniref:uncharacterized protein n=1 Tax=Saccharomycodes ludwigii TaxID=36035 RepID=UPI001E8A6948|nr:hypothetical protein SCDLUD_001579 [Saccharomycodes ludwigii]KAH3901799.1 hypothetical protein SCDLUD_001579 [Saccharomycodes ludwigii]